MIFKSPERPLFNHNDNPKQFSRLQLSDRVQTASQDEDVDNSLHRTRVALDTFQQVDVSLEL